MRLIGEVFIEAAILFHLHRSPQMLGQLAGTAKQCFSAKRSAHGPRVRSPVSFSGERFLSCSIGTAQLQRSDLLLETFGEPHRAPRESRPTVSVPLFFASSYSSAFAGPHTLVRPPS